MAQRQVEKLLSDEDTVIKTIKATHGALDDFHFNLRPLLSVIEDIMSLASRKRQEIKDIDDKRNALFDNISSGNKIMQDELVLKINVIAWEILRNFSGGENLHETILDIFKALSPFFWAGKAVLALAAFAVNYGEFCLVQQLHSATTNTVAQAIAFLEDFPTETELKRTFRDMNRLIEAVLKMTKCICESVDLESHQYLQHDLVLENMTSKIPKCTYWIIRSVVICQSRLSNVLNAYESNTPSSIEASNVSNLAMNVSRLADWMRKQIDLCYMRAKENRIRDLIQKLKVLFENTSNEDNVMVLKALISEQELGPLYEGRNKRKVRIHALKNKIVLLYISELKHLPLELAALSKIYLASREKPTRFEIVWLPVVDESSSDKREMKQMFKDIQNRMPWLSFRELSLVDPAVVKYIRDEWQFKRRSMIKVLDQQGRLLKNHDAMHMITIWGGLAEPFSADMEEQLWANESWGVDLLLKHIEPSTAQWAAEGKYLCLYGGDNIDWITNFITTISAIFKEAQMPLTKLYMGRDNTNKNVEKNNAVNSTGNLGDIDLDPLAIGLFWARLESIWHSRVQIGMSPESDEIIKEVFKMRSFDCSGRGWAIISRGSTEMAEAMGDTMLKALSEYDQWKGNVEEKGFMSAVRDYMSSFGTSRSCNRFLAPRGRGIPEKMECFECRREMERSIMFSCCGD